MPENTILDKNINGLTWRIAGLILSTFLSGGYFLVNGYYNIIQKMDETKLHNTVLDNKYDQLKEISNRHEHQIQELQSNMMRGQPSSHQVVR